MMPKLITTSSGEPGARRAARVLVLSNAQLLLIQNAAELATNPSAFLHSVSNTLTTTGQVSTHDASASACKA
jgi:hypothetical protein